MIEIILIVAGITVCFLLGLWSMWIMLDVGVQEDTSNKYGSFERWLAAGFFGIALFLASFTVGWKLLIKLSEILAG